MTSKINTELELIDRLKEIGEYTRKPKAQTIQTFYAIKHVADIHANMDDDAEMFVSTTHLQNMGIHRKIYQRVFNFALEFVSEDWEWVKGKCRVIKKFTPQFAQLLEDAKDLVVPQAIITGYAHSTTNLENKDLIEQKWSSATNRGFQDYYTSTSASPFRKYHPLQSWKKEARNNLFKGCWDVDLKSAHTTIAFYELNMSDCNLEMAWALHPENKDVLIDRIMNDFKCTKEVAKTYRCYLTAKKQNFFGVKWFDKLHMEIERRAKRKFSEVIHNGKKVKINTMHKYFTCVEQMIMNDLSERNDIDSVFNMHDGLISQTKPTQNYITYNNNNYPITAEAI